MVINKNLNVEENIYNYNEEEIYKNLRNIWDDIEYEDILSIPIALHEKTKECLSFIDNTNPEINGGLSIVVPLYLIKFNIQTDIEIHINRLINIFIKYQIQNYDCKNF